MHFTDLRVKLIRFFKNNKYVIYIAIIVITIIIAINMFLGKLKDNEPPSTIYEPHNPIISGDKITSKKTQKDIESSINELMEFCKNKEYESAYNLLCDECKEYRFKNDLKKFKSYVDSIFDKNKVYSIQDYSNKDNVYIYEVSIFEDIMATGMNNEESDEMDVEKIALIKENNGYKLSIGGFIKVEELENIIEDDYMKVSLEKKITYYDKAIYRIKIKNKTNNTIVIDRNSEKDCISVSLNGDVRNEQRDDYSNYEKVIRGNDTREFDIEFPVYFDESRTPTAILLNKVCVLERYTGVADLWEQELSKAIKKYSVTINL